MPCIRKGIVMHHIFKQGSNSNKPTLLLLHGTGGTESDLIPLAKEIDDAASILGIRGNVLEQGMPRFFRRLYDGKFDEEDLMFRTKELSAFIDRMAQTYSFNRENAVAIGYSNGANIAGNLLFHYGSVLKGAILFHPMVPRRGIQIPDLQNMPIFIGAGTNDPICPPEEANELEEILLQANADVYVHWEDDGHQISHGEIKAAKTWYKNNF